MAGLWNTWTDKETGEVVESYTMVTLNADHHPLLRRMHHPDPTRPETMQDKRAVVPLAPSAFEVWLLGTIEKATAALQLGTPRSTTRGRISRRCWERRQAAFRPLSLPEGVSLAEWVA